jgi:hypothetical protein
MQRRKFLKGLAATASFPFASNLRAFSDSARDSPAVPAQIKAFCLDFNWFSDPVNKESRFAPPGHFAQADPEEHVRWYSNLGANVIQTFAVSCNGYAWYRNGFVPPEPGLKYDFLPEVVRLGHKKEMLVMGYFCVGSNSKWGLDHPDLSYGAPSIFHIPFTDAYLDYLDHSMEDAIRKTGMDGYMIDWVWNPQSKLRADGWLPAEKDLYQQLTGKPFPATGRPDAESTLAYERKAIDRCWERIKEARNRANPRCIIWLSCYDFSNPTVTNSRMLKEVDWSMNESPDPKLYRLGRQMAGPNTRMIQNVVGWLEHNAEEFLSDPANRSLDLYGFATPRDNSLLPSVKEYLTKPMACFSGTDKASVNDRNIAALARFYRGLPFSGKKTNATCG